MMDKENIKQVVIETVASVLRQKDIVLDEHKTFGELGADELDMFEFVLKIEDAFTLEISDDDTKKLVSIAETVSYIAARKTI